MLFVRPAPRPVALLGSLLTLGVVGAGVPIDKTGWTAELSTLFHDVAGTVTILDEDTYRVDHFQYDGEGIVVYLYLGADDASFDLGLRTGPQLVGPIEFDGDTLIVQLPDGETFEPYNAISVWCEAAGVSFGHGTFVAPTSSRTGISTAMSGRWTCWSI